MKTSIFALAAAAALIAAPLQAQTTSPGTSGGTTTSPAITTTPGQGMGSGTAPNVSPNANTNTNTTGSLGGMWYTSPVGPNQWAASDLIGQSVYNRANERIGEVNELVVERDGRVSAAIIGVGGFLGIGERNVAVNFSSMQTTVDNNNAMRVVIDIDRNRLREAPEFRNPTGWGAR